MSKPQKPLKMRMAWTARGPRPSHFPHPVFRPNGRVRKGCWRVDDNGRLISVNDRDRMSVLQLAVWEGARYSELMEEKRLIQRALDQGWVSPWGRDIETAGVQPVARPQEVPPRPIEAEVAPGAATALSLNDLCALILEKAGRLVEIGVEVANVD